MSKLKASHKTWDERSADALSGRMTVDAGALLDLIREVNPTGRGRNADETAARYSIKSKLQSLLVRRFGDDIDVVPDPAGPADVVLLRHRYQGGNGCHTVLSALDDDARSWVQRVMDLGLDAPSVPSSAPRSEVSSPQGQRTSSLRSRDADDEPAVDTLLAAAQEAFDAFDYPEAEGLLVRAVSESEGALKAVLAYLAFAVDTLAADADVLVLSSRLADVVLVHPKAALFLALAAARTGDEDRALHHLAHTTDPRAAEVFTLLAQRALKDKDEGRAARHARAAEERDPTHPELQTVASQIARLRAEERGPREAALIALMTAGHDKDALAEAHRVLARWPESEVARRVVHKAEERLRAGEGKLLLASADQAIANGDFEVALESLRRALKCPLESQEREGALVRVQHVEATVREKGAKARVVEVVTLLSQGDRARGLAAYAELGVDLRARVRRTHDAPSLGWIDRLPAGRVRVVVEAVLALERAAALVDKDPGTAFGLIAPHERVLGSLSLAQDITSRARAAVAEERRRRSLTVLAEAEAAMGNDQLSTARDLIAKVDSTGLKGEEQSRFSALQAWVAEGEDVALSAARFTRLRIAGSFAAAQKQASDLASRTRGGSSARWTAEKEAVARHVAETYKPIVDLHDGGAELLQHPELSRHDMPSAAWVMDKGHHLFLVTGESVWLFIRVIDLRTGRVVETVRIAMDERMEEPSIRVYDHSVIVTACGGWVEFSLPGWEVVRRQVFNWSRDRGFVYRKGLLAPGTRMMWSVFEDDDDSNTIVKVADVDGELGGRVFKSIEAAFLVPGANPPTFAVTKTYKGPDDRQQYAVAFHEVSGTQIGRTDSQVEPRAVIAHPSGTGWLLLMWADDSSADWKLCLLELSERFEVLASRAISGTTTDYHWWPSAVPALDLRMAFLLCRMAGDQTVLLALRYDGALGERPTEVYRVDVPRRTRLFHDASGRRAFAIVDRPAGLETVELGATPPVLAPEAPVHEILRPLMAISCAHDLGISGTSYKMFRAIRRLVPSARPARMAELEAAAGDDVQERINVFYGILQGGWVGFAAEVLARIQAAHPEESSVKLAGFSLLVGRRAWRELHEQLKACDPACFNGVDMAHYHHLLALSSATLGDIEAAREHMALTTAKPDQFSAPATAYRVHCEGWAKDLKTILEVFATPESPEDLHFDAPTVRQHRAVLRAADERLAVGDPEGAIAVLERPLVWDLGEVQTLARLAEAHLALSPSTGRGRFRKGLALAAFAGVMEFGHTLWRSELLAPGATYTEERINALLAQALAWLDADFGVSRTELIRRRG